jgi:methylenetetrahydrofolate dehydrogenase (NADP+)/methenyltetrahydrofolate cyclohydrolase
MFDGKQIRDEILKSVAEKVVEMERKPNLAEFLIGDDIISTKYADLKMKMATKTGSHFSLYKFDDKDSMDDVLEAIHFLNTDEETDGIMIQIPVPAKFDRDKLISAIDAKKDVDGLRYCLGLDSDFKPPVVLAILEAVKRSGVDLKTAKIVMIGHGFLVGKPLARVLREQNIVPLVILNEVKNLTDNTRSFADAQDDILNADIIISAVGKAGLIKPEMVKEGVVLIDAGTAEDNGELKGDIDPEAYKKASYYTPVPGGIGPVTIAKLLENLAKK